MAKNNNVVVRKDWGAIFKYSAITGLLCLLFGVFAHSIISTKAGVGDNWLIYLDEQSVTQAKEKAACNPTGFIDKALYGITNKQVLCGSLGQKDQQLADAERQFEMAKKKVYSWSTGTN